MLLPLKSFSRLTSLVPVQFNKPLRNPSRLRFEKITKSNTKHCTYLQILENHKRADWEKKN